MVRVCAVCCYVIRILAAREVVGVEVACWKCRW